jgi:hypothetical protein
LYQRSVGLSLRGFDGLSGFGEAIFQGLGLLPQAFRLIVKCVQLPLHCLCLVSHGSELVFDRVGLLFDGEVLQDGNYHEARSSESQKYRAPGQHSIGYGSLPPILQKFFNSLSVHIVIAILALTASVISAFCLVSLIAFPPKSLRRLLLGAALSLTGVYGFLSAFFLTL